MQGRSNKGPCSTPPPRPSTRGCSWGPRCWQSREHRAADAAQATHAQTVLPTSPEESQELLGQAPMWQSERQGHPSIHHPCRSAGAAATLALCHSMPLLRCPAPSSSSCSRMGTNQCETTPWPRPDVCLPPPTPPIIYFFLEEKAASPRGLHAGI